MKRLRLVELKIQPVVALDDDGKDLELMTVPPVTIKARDWGGYPEKMAQELKEKEEELNVGTADSR